MAEAKQVVKKPASNGSLVGNINADLILKNAGKGLQNVTNYDITNPK